MALCGETPLLGLPPVHLTLVVGSSPPIELVPIQVVSQLLGLTGSLCRSSAYEPLAWSALGGNRSAATEERQQSGLHVTGYGAADDRAGTQFPAKPPAMSPRPYAAGTGPPRRRFGARLASA